MKKILIIGIIVVVIGGSIGTYLYVNSKPYLAKKIKELGGTSVDVSSFDKGFLKAWHDAIIAGEFQFTYKEKNYAIKGGKRIS